MMSAWKFIQNDLGKSHATKHNSHLNIYFKNQHDMALSDAKNFTNKRILWSFFFFYYPKVLFLGLSFQSLAVLWVTLAPNNWESDPGALKV